MKLWVIPCTCILLMGLIISGCSGGSEPVTPDARLNDINVTTEPITRTHLWGYWDINVDIESRSVEVIPDRLMMFTVNIVKFLNNDPIGIQFSFNGTTPGAGYVDVDLDVTIKHPLDDAGFNGYDVRGIFIGDGSGTLAYNTDLTYPVNGTDQVLLNADGYTRWYNPSEFLVPKIGGYVPGNFATSGYSGSATLNGYKYFGEDFAATDKLWDKLISGLPNTGHFIAGSSNTRNYQVRLPIPDPGTIYGYAVTADWAGIAPEYHPSHAPEVVGCQVIDSSNVYYVEPMDNGGTLKLDISLFAWNDQPSQIYIESSVLSSLYEFTPTDMIPVGSGGQYSTYHVEIPSDNVTSVTDQEFWVVTECEGYDYTNDLGIPNEAGTDPLAAIFRYDLPVLNEIPAWIEVLIPDGGEVWASGTDEEITWSSEFITGTVYIEYSKDDFTSDINPIAADEPDDGSLVWTDIPVDPSETVKVRITSTENPTVSDISDVNFTIIEPWIEVLTPNGGEEFVAGTAADITWTSNVPGPVHIRYSKDYFVSDDISIVSWEENDGSYTWDPIPSDFSDTVVVKVIFAGDPSVYDLSDAFFSIAQPGWTRTWGGNNEVAGNGVCIDGSGNIYVTGDYMGNAYFDPDGGDPYPGFGGQDVFLSKFDPFGNFEWAKTWGGTEWDKGTAVDTDSYGNVYVTGYFGSTVDFNPDGGDPHTSNGLWDVFLSKFDSSGALQWVRTWGHIWNDAGYDLTVDNLGYVYVTGSFQNMVNFDPDGLETRTSNGLEDVFLTGFDVLGNHTMVETWGGVTTDVGNGVCHTASGSICVTGYFTQSVDFDPDGGDLHISNGTFDAFLSSFWGSYQWARTWGGSSYDRGLGVSADSTGKIYVTGNIRETVDLNPAGGDLHTSNGEEDAYLSVFDLSGNLQWANSWGGPGRDLGNSVAADLSGNHYVTGYFEDIVDFQPGGGDPQFSNGMRDAFLSSFDSSGTFNWARTWGEEDWDVGNGTAIDSSGIAFVTGGFKFVVDFAPAYPSCNVNPDVHTSGGNYDAFLTRYRSDGCW